MDHRAIIIDVRERGGSFAFKYRVTLTQVESLLKLSAIAITKLVAGEAIHTDCSVLMRAN
jgi:hypothetical protein